MLFSLSKSCKIFTSTESTESTTSIIENRLYVIKFISTLALFTCVQKSHNTHPDRTHEMAGVIVRGSEMKCTGLNDNNGDLVERTMARILAST